MTLKVPPPPPIANQDPTFNRWLLELTSILNADGSISLFNAQLTGTPTAPTAAPGTNTTQIATTAFVVANSASSPSNSNPLVDGTAAPGTLTTYSRGDHVHPTDTTRAPLASPALTGTPTSTTPAPGDNSTNIATTAFVQSTIGNNPQIRNGSGAPAAGLGNNGDLYLNNTGGAGTRLYGKISGAWVAIA